MTPQLAARLTIHEPDLAGMTTAGEGVLRAPLLAPVPDERPELDDACLPALWRRESLHRRMLGMFDVAAAALALFVILGLTGNEHRRALRARLHAAVGGALQDRRPLRP